MAQSTEIKWVAVLVERGFIVEARGFRRKSEAIKQERKWRKNINPDYDETGILPLILGSD
jgi:hypothetical protein